MIAPLTIAARDEERSIGACLDSVLAAIAWAQARLPVTIEPLVVLDDCTDGTERAVRARGVPCVSSTGGKVEAQRRGLRPGDAAIFTDADIVLERETLAAMLNLLLARPEVQVVSPPLVPLPPRRRGRLAHAVHVYNCNRGFSSQRTWFNGRCFALRRWAIPTPAELAPRVARLPHDAFYRFDEGLRVDDVHLSRQLAASHGASAFAETAVGRVHYRAPETLRGMYRYYRRLRRELERESLLFPELEPAHRRLGRRRADLLASASPGERLAYAEFQGWLLLCRVGYRVDRFVQRRLRLRRNAWPAIAETKQ
ncbi:MAG TPA: hypothetical protein VMB50_00160 [Myxococcales bacterium]|nr:hypothetical protein [Myxococcales bacterium]